LYRGADGQWQLQASGTLFPLFGVAGAANDLYAGGRRATVLHTTGVGGPAGCLANNDCACLTDDDCPATHYCASGGVCTARKPKTATCADADCKAAPCHECKDALFCTDGVCCDGMCGGACQACNLTGSEGTCTTLPANQQPRGARAACVGAGSPPCGGYCDGTNGNACFYPTVPCGSSACDTVNNHTLINAPLCAGGTCQSPTFSSCEPYACNTGTGTCDADCQPFPTSPPQPGCADTYPICTVQPTPSPGLCTRYPGSPCSKGSDCTTGLCRTNCCSATVCAPTACVPTAGAPSTAYYIQDCTIDGGGCVVVNPNSPSPCPMGTTCNASTGVCG
jgi:hypothetical protein